MGKGKIKYEQPDGPAIVRENFVQDRVISPFAGAPKAWRNLPPIEALYAKRKLEGGIRGATAYQRLEAGRQYGQYYRDAQSSGRDSTQAMNVNRCAGEGSIGPKQANAMAMLRKLKEKMCRNDAAIIEGVCGREEQPAEALRKLFGDDYEKATMPRIWEALDSLVKATEALLGAPPKSGLRVVRDL